jgi:hypothetical protein
MTAEEWQDEVDERLGAQERDFAAYRTEAARRMTEMERQAERMRAQARNGDAGLVLLLLVLIASFLYCAYRMDALDARLKDTPGAPLRARR